MIQLKVTHNSIKLKLTDSRIYQILRIYQVHKQTDHYQDTSIKNPDFSSHEIRSKESND